MPEEIFGIPAHPLMVHAPVVLVPLTALVALVYGVVPPLRRHLGWLLALLALAAAGASVAAVLSGEAFAAKLGSSPAIARHQDLGEAMRNFVVLLAVAAIALVVVDWLRIRRSRRAAESEAPGAAAAPRSGSLVLVGVSVVLTVGVLGLAGAATAYAVRAGHSGAEMVWGQVEGG
ncbi:MAG TPA: DUF2231 domain-containing protein [Cryptosporangiaceae bacterium]|nr:DUF2231 domain-containing protein [Cryptosporangiaceae bacterium]